MPGAEHSPPPFMNDLCSSRPLPGPGFTASDGHGVSRFSRMEFLDMHGSSTPRDRATLAFERTRLLPSLLAGAVGLAFDMVRRQHDMIPESP